MKKFKVICFGVFFLIISTIFYRHIYIWADKEERNKLILKFDNRPNHIQSLDLTRLIWKSELEDMAIEKIAQHSFSKLSLKNNRITSKTFEKLISKNNIDKLDVSDNKIDGNVIKIFKIHSKDFKISELDISNNNIKVSDFGKLLEVLQETTIHTISIGNYGKISNEEFNDFLNYFLNLKDKENFKRIIIEWELTYDQIKKLNYCLKNLIKEKSSSNIPKFEISFYHLEEEELEALTRTTLETTYKSNQKLLKLELHHHFIRNLGLPNKIERIKRHFDSLSK